MERYFILDKFNTYYDWHLIVTAKDITPSEPKTYLVELDGMHGSLDLSESLTGEIIYKDRTIEASFWTDYGNYRDRDKLLREIITALHGKKVKIIEPDDPTHYYLGRIKIKSSSNSLPYLTFTIEATCEPWRYAIEDTVRQVMARSTPTDIVINYNGVKTIIPEIEISGIEHSNQVYTDGNVTIVENGIETHLTEGRWKATGVILRQGVNILTISGSGVVTISYKEADL